MPLSNAVFLDFYVQLSHLPILNDLQLPFFVSFCYNGVMKRNVYQRNVYRTLKTRFFVNYVGNVIPQSNNVFSTLGVNVVVHHSKKWLFCLLS